MACELTIVTIADSLSKRELKLQGEWSKDTDNVKLLLNDGVSSWIGKFESGDVSDDMLSQLVLDRNQYWERIKTALGRTTFSSAESKFVYTFEGDELSWAKMITPEVSQLHGKVQLRNVAPTNHGELVRSLLDSYSTVLEDLTQSIARYNQLQKEYEEITLAFQDCSKIKNEMESTLYTKFALILNEKKQYVRRVTGENPTEDFGPVPNSDTKSREPPQTTSVPLKEFSKMIKRDKSVTGERSPKKQMLEPQAGPSRDFEDMDF